ncbi:hypothetical protein [Bacillus sp. B15-48]|uniref:hypothetical protein n=1 Tax=Bacillus sp. B15-48 TaxID=1548601 RepID=UPI00193ECB0F|nr:hypothetical protein [Bacillus sp. B15-48]MBM4762924.1 hypothetical protein [Bacillus sp. B15-48]
MSKSKNKLKDKALSAVNKFKATIKEKYFQLADIPSVSVQELADFVQSHPNTAKNQKKLLGITFTFYHLQIENNSFYLETNDFRILQLDVFLNGTPFIAYRSYRDFYRLNTPIKWKQ